MPTLIPILARCVVGLLLVVVALTGCHDPRFDVNETLPAYPGVSSKLRILDEGQERTSALKNWGMESEKDHAVVVQQIIRNDSDDRLSVYRHPPFQAELILVKTAEGSGVSLSGRGLDYKRTRYQHVGLRAIDPHSMDEREYILTRLFDLSQPGTYTVEIESRYLVDDKQGLGYFETNPEPIEFTVE